MWKDFSRSYLSHNPTAARTMAAAALAAAFFLALLCGLFYNAWAYDVDRILREEGSWHVRLTMPRTDAAWRKRRNFWNSLPMWIPSRSTKNYPDRRKRWSN